MAKRKNPAAVALGRLGGKTVTAKKIKHLRKITKMRLQKQAAAKKNGLAKLSA